MTLQYSVVVRNAKLDVVEAVIGPSAVLKIFTGVRPVNCAAPDAGTVLATANLPVDWMNGAAGGSKAMLGSWVDNSADNGGDAGYFRIYAADGVTCHAQGSITATGGGGDMTLASITLVATQVFTITGFTLNAGNA